MTPRYVFVAGLHRSGTSLLADLIADFPDVSGIRGAPVPEQEGVYLQGAIPHTAAHGRPMHFATDPAQHHVEGGRYDTLETRERLRSDWNAWFDPRARWRVEKSPVNLTRMRLYQQLFPLAQFVVILRHPQAVAGAVAKWVEMTRAEAVAHWIAAHDQLRADLPYLHNVLVLRYEDLVAAPGDITAAIARFLDLDHAAPTPRDISNRNANYPVWDLDEEELGACAQWGYGGQGHVAAWSPIVQHMLGATRRDVGEILRALPAR
ncbi:Sulfotransferase family protein [Poseidonocella pacifica]|uniref:Sulfotransferase family protein n=1 Tax=Poseidonocella pacifica TaxID=871651 RepID=A0A1I0X4Q6_9RHOB|nr:sulfotransferase [Poseidonocella pacifica]SFA96022.1 Sulfotransferase family protein [Poseidonocella pacifica]